MKKQAYIAPVAAKITIEAPMIMAGSVQEDGTHVVIEDDPEDGDAWNEGI